MTDKATQEVAKAKLSAELLLLKVDLDLNAIEVQYFDAPDHSDPLNIYPVLSCKINIKPGPLGWSVSTERANRNNGYILDRLVKGLAEKIQAFPTQYACDDETSSV